jgi:hypothetical protein
VVNTSPPRHRGPAWAEGEVSGRLNFQRNLARYDTRVKRTAILVTLLLLGTFHSIVLLHAAEDADEALRVRALLGLNNFTGVSVTISGTSPPRLAKDRLKTMVELRLRQAGLLRPQIESSLQNIAVVEIRLSAVPIPDIGFAVSYDVRLSGVGKPAWSPQYTEAVWWHEGGVLTSTRDLIETDVEKTVSNILDKLLNDFLKANPEQRPKTQ